MTIKTLIDKQDNAEIIRDQIAAILVAEVSAQQVLAIAAAEDPDLWKLRVFVERSNPWEQFLTAPVTDKSPLVNVWWSNSNNDPSASNTFERQKYTGVFNIDCYGYAETADDPGGGHTPGDQEAAFEAHRAARLVRNILMAAIYQHLGLKGLVWSRIIRSINIEQPEQDGRVIQNIVGARLALDVDFSEFAPQVVPETLEYLAIDVVRLSDGLLILEADYEYPLP